MKKLKFSNLDRILILAPHPDDESIACGGLLLKYATQCSIIVFTDGQHGGKKGKDKVKVIKSRKKEFVKAMKFAGIKNYSFLDIEDGKLSQNFNKFTTINFNNYDYIFCPTPKDEHPDHACVHGFIREINSEAKIFTYEATTPLADPSHCLDISNVINKKRKLISYYKSQVKQVDYITKTIGLNSFRGFSVYPAISYAEVYQKIS